MTTMPINAAKPDVALSLLRDCLSGSGRIIPSKHFRDELKNEGLTIPDAWQVLRSGSISKPPEHDIKTGEWKYKIEGYEPGGKWLCIVFSFKQVDLACLITVFSVESQERTT